MAGVKEVRGVQNATFFYTIDGLFYRADNSSGNSVFLTCKERGCPSRASMPLVVAERNVNSFIMRYEHNHLPDPNFVGVCGLRQSIVERCKNETTELRRIFDEECAR